MSYHHLLKFFIFSSLITTVSTAQAVSEIDMIKSSEQNLTANLATDPQVDLGSLTFQSQEIQPSTNLLGSTHNTSDQILSSEKLRKAPVTLGEALANEPGIHSNSYGGGASAPIIRGQEGKRIKVLQNNTEVVDMANMSPDHAIMVDPSLAEQVEIVRGPSTLLYSSGNSAGLINVIDNVIPKSMPNNNFSGEITQRFNTNTHEKLSSGAFNIGLGSQVAMHVSGLKRSADNYQTPNYLYKNEGKTQTLDYVPNSHADSEVVNLGVSWINDKGFLGTSYSKRKDQYGLPAHNHLMHDCHADTLAIRSRIQKPYLIVYPHLMDDEDVDYNNPGLSCHSHDDESQPAHNHTGAPWIDMTSEHYDVRGEVAQPIKGLDKLRFNASRVDYHHDELEGSERSNFFDNQGKVVRFDISHTPLLSGKLTGTLGAQYLTQTNSALAPPPQEEYFLNQPLLNKNKTNNFAVFGMERYQSGDWTYEMSLRHEKQKVEMDYDIKRIQEYTDDLPDLSAHKDHATSAAAAVHWQFQPDSQLSFTASHQERLPNAQELYTHGFHLATNSFEIGNRHLQTEKSNNFELSLKHQGKKLDYQLSSYYYDFDNYIYLLTLNEGRGGKSMENDDDLKLNRYSQSPARFYGFEGNIGYQFSPDYHVSLYGDYINGRLVNLPSIPGRVDAYGNRPEIKQPDRYTPRLPPMRLGTRVNASLTDKLSAELDYYHVFKQDKLSKFEHTTPGYNMLNLGLNYKTPLAVMDSEFFIKGNNLLNEPVYSHTSFLPNLPQMGRNVTLGVNFKF